MSRPNYLQCIMTPEIIRSIREEQELYDRNPEAYEQQQQYARDEQLREQEEISHQMQLEQQREDEEREQEQWGWDNP